MKTQALKLVSLFLISTFLFSCAKEDDGIYFNPSSEVVTLNKVSTYSTIETEILNLVNEHRKNMGLSELVTLNIVSSVAKGHTDYMVETGTVNHDNFSQRAQTLMDNANAKSVGENVAYGFSSAQGVLNGWLNSDEHRKILENPAYTHFGISTEANSEGRNYFTQIFIKQ